MIPHRRCDPLYPDRERCSTMVDAIASGTDGGVAGRSGARHTTPMPSRPDRRPRLVALLLLVAILTAAAWSTVAAAPALPACKVADTLTKHRLMRDWSRSILDLTFRLPSTYAPSDLRSTGDAGLNSGYRVRSLVLADLKAMASAARAAGARFSVQSAYRSYATQKATFDYWVSVDGYAEAIKTSARAGHSEHQLGTTIDFRSYGGSAPWYHSDWATTKAGAWLKSNAWKYGWVMSYPKGKSTVTCYSYEPWHYRYVGRQRAATIRASGLTLREFLWREQNLPAPTPPAAPTPTPTKAPAVAGTPVLAPTAAPTRPPTATPTRPPTAAPTVAPTPSPSAAPARTPAPTPVPAPTASPAPPAPSPTPSPPPSATPQPPPAGTAEPSPTEPATAAASATATSDGSTAAATPSP